MKYSELNQNDFLRSLKKGEVEAYTYLVQTYNRRLFAYAMSLNNDRAIAQDLVQNVFLKTWENRKNLSITKSLKNYLYKSVYNEFINQYRKNKAVLILDQLYVETLERILKGSEKEAESIEKMINLMNEEIQQLPKKCKRIFLLSKKEGLTNHEIADYLDLSVKTVESQITIAFSTLRKKMKQRVQSILLFFYPKSCIITNSNNE
ncbi:RNA polymerase sigma-70 factor [Flavobacteriaceae bacterium F08102]|nr:RNA polymerase sigma-70 factor [Flavobacteriaceae bacterium F08102]